MMYIQKCAGQVVLAFFKRNSLFGILVNRTRRINNSAHSKVTVQKEDQENTVEIKIDKKTISKLERVSLVDFNNEGGIQRLEAAIKFAQKLREVELDSSVKPMYSVLENEKLELREDKVTEGNCRDEILKNAKLLEDEYFIAPPGNIPKSS